MHLYSLNVLNHQPISGDSNSIVRGGWEGRDRRGEVGGFGVNKKEKGGSKMFEMEKYL